jgi:glutamate synthase domain-containing protein 3
MAINAEEMDAFTTEDKRQADELERIIDSVLLSNRSMEKQRKKISFTVNNDSNPPNAAVQEEIEKRYQAAGWESVRFHHSYVKGYDDFWCLSVTLTRKLRE